MDRNDKTDAALSALDTLRATLTTVGDPAALSLLLATTVRRELRAAEERIADVLPPLTPADFVKACNGDHAIRAEVEAFRDRRWSVVDVSDLPDDGEGWTILRGSSRFEVREVPRYEARRVGGVKLDGNGNPRGDAEGSVVWDNEHNEEADVYLGTDTPDDEPIPDPDKSAAAMLGELPDTARTVYLVWDTEEGARAHVGFRCGGIVEEYDPTDEDSATEAAEQANVEDYRTNACGWPFAHSYASAIDEREGEDFAAAGFVIARHEPSGQVYAGVDGGGYDFLEAHWSKVYLRVLLFGKYASGTIYVPTDAGLRRVVRAGV